jgi:hypothetical protein
LHAVNVLPVPPFGPMTVIMGAELADPEPRRRAIAIASAKDT